LCLAVPGKILSIKDPAEADDPPLFRMGRVDFGGIVKEIALGFVPEARVGDYVIAHVGFAIGRLDECEAARIFSYLRQMDPLREIQGGAP